MPIRDATADDVAAIRRVVEASWESDYPAILSRESIDAGVDEWYAPDQIRDAVERARTLVLVAEDEGTVVGFVHCLRTGDEGNVLRLYVDPAHRGGGIGSDLLERARATLAEQGVDRLQATVLRENEPGNEFYRSFGFERVDAGETVIGGERYAENRYRLAL